MTASFLIIDQLEKSLIGLRKECGSFGKKTLKEAISKSLQNIESGKKNDSLIDLEIIINPYFMVINELLKDHLVSVLVMITNLFQYAIEEISPSEELTKNILHSMFNLFKQKKIITDEIKAKAAKVISCCIENPNVRVSIHGEILSEIFNFLLDLQNTSPATAGEILSMTIQNLFRVYLALIEPSSKDTVEPVTVEDVARQVVDEIVNKYIGAPTSAIDDVITIVRTFSHAIEKFQLTESTLMTCSEAILALIEADNPIVETDEFAKLLQEDIHVTLIGLSIDEHQSLIGITAKLIILVWQKFHKLYVVGLNEVFDRGLATALASPYPKTVVRAIKLFNELAKYPQILVDAYVNYDCDQTGFFKNVYKNLTERIVNCAKPGQKDPEMQKSSLVTTITILDGLWTYFKEKSAQKKAEEDEGNIYLEAKKAKNVLEEGMRLFKTKEKKGLQFFKDHGICGQTPEEIANFFYNTPTLDPASIGNIIGSNNPESVAILHSFMDQFDFKGMTFEQAFRAFLSKFLIPGESQMIDRIMEQFGSKYYNDNPSLFSCAETVYVLAFSALMLHTDAHHPTLKKHMTLPEFIANNRGIDQGNDIPKEFLTDLYNGITSKKIFVSRDALPNSFLLSREQQAEMYRQQCHQAIQAARNTTQDAKNLVFHRAESHLLVGPMFQTVWQAILAALTMSFEMTDDEKLVDLILQGFTLCTHIASHSYVTEALQVLVDSFAKFTRLRTSAIEDVKTKNILCTNALIMCAIEDHIYLKGAWSIVLGEISALDVIMDSQKYVCNMNKTDEIFLLSADLDRESIIDFVDAMCKVSTNELSANPPRMFSLLKLSDIAYYNMDRPIILWKEIWKIIGSHLSLQGSRGDLEVALTTIDILRQLARKFIPKQDQGSSISLQSHFLQPFCDIIYQTRDHSMRELILECTQHLVDEHASNLMSGWDVVFQILTFAAMSEELKKHGFSIVEQIIHKHMQAVIPYSVHLVAMISSFVISDANAEICFEATKLFLIIADAIPAKHVNAWESLLQSLGKCNQHPFFNVKQSAEEVLLNIIIDKGAVRGILTNNLWEFIIQHSFPDLFEFPEDDNPQIYKHNIEIINKIVDEVAINHHEAIKPHILLFIRFFKFFTQSENDNFSRAVIKAFGKYTVKCHDDFDDNLIDEIIQVWESYVPKFARLVVYVETLSNVLATFQHSENAYTRLMVILGKVVKWTIAQKEDNNGHRLLCSARKAYFSGLIRHNEVEQSADYLEGTLELYAEFEGKATNEFWDKLVEASFQGVADASDDIYNACVNKSMKTMLNLVQTESPIVRKQLMRIVKRKLSQ